MTGPDKYREIRSHGVARVATALGFTWDGRGIKPCPSCNADRRGSADGRAPVGVVHEGKGWECHRCKEKGDAVTLLCWHVCNARLESGDPRWKDVLARATALNLTTPPPPGQVRPAPENGAPSKPPPIALVRKLWDACKPAGEIPSVAEWLEARKLAPAELAARDLVRGLPGQFVMPDWAWFSGESWLNAKQQFRVIVPLFDATGALASVHARALKPQLANGRDKAVSPKGYTVRLLVMANRLAQRLLAGDPEAIAQAKALGVLVVEGVPDFLTAATEWGEADTPPVMGLINGSWPRVGSDLAARIPDGCRVVLATHHDRDGQKYSDNVAATLKARHDSGDVLLVRFDAVNEKGDLNDHRKAGGAIDLERATALGASSAPTAEEGIPPAPDTPAAGPGALEGLEDLSSSSTLEEVQGALDAWASEVNIDDKLERSYARERALELVKRVVAVNGPAAMVDSALAKYVDAERAAKKKPRPHLHVVQPGEGGAQAGSGDTIVRDLRSKSPLAIRRILQDDQLRNQVKHLRDRALRFDQMAMKPVLGDRLLTEDDITEIQADVELAFPGNEKGDGLFFNREMIEHAVYLMARKSPFHPLQEYFAGLKWDGQTRIDFVPEEILDIDKPSDAVKLMNRKWYLGAAARVLTPGCYVKSMLILTGVQNASKSSYFKRLVPQSRYFNDKPIDIRSKEAEMMLARVMIQEWAELRTLQGRTSEEAKAFISSQSGQVILKYSNDVTDLPRTSVIVGTTNDDHFLEDTTGNVRFWPIRVGRDIDLARTDEWRDQLWAEAAAALARGEQHWPTREEEELIAREVHPHFEKADAWEDPLLGAIASVGGNNFTMDELLKGFLGDKPRDWDDRSVNRVRALLRKHNFTNNGRKQTSHAKARTWVKNEAQGNLPLDHPDHRKTT